jgi:hypothetical protein
MITALAMTLDIPVSELVEDVGHDGSEVIFPLLKEPMCRKGFHSQEIVRLAFKSGFAMTPFELFPTIMANDHSTTHKVWDETYSRAFFMGAVNSTSGILEGRGTSCKHAVHNSCGTLYDPDPNGTVYPFSFQDCEAQGFHPSRLWIFTRWQ